MVKEAIKDDAVYIVTLSKSIPVGRAKINPGPRVRLRGDVLKAAQALKAVISFEPV